MRPPPPASGSHPSSAPLAHPPSSKPQATQAPLTAQRGAQNPSAGASNQSAQTALAPKEAHKAKPGHGKAPPAPGKLPVHLAHMHACRHTARSHDMMVLPMLAAV